MGKRSFLLLPLLLVLLPGCSAKFTNLTPRALPRNEAGLYPFEVAMTSQEQALKWKTIQPTLRIGEDSYAMQPTPLMTNRWEVVVSLAPETKVINYRFQFQFLKQGMKREIADSASSGYYSLQITDAAPADAAPAGTPAPTPAPAPEKSEK